MSFLKRFFNICSHRFSWPRTDSQGRDYVVCLRCGIAFIYDLSSMRRTRQLHLDEAARTHN